MPEIKYKDFQRTLEGKQFEPVYLFCGEEDFLIQECLDTIIAKTLDDSTKGFNLDVVYGSKADAKDVIAHASSFPMMSQKRIVVVKEFEKLVATETSREIVSSYLQRPLESTYLLLVAEDPDFRKKPFNELKKKAGVVVCSQMYDNQVPMWIAARIRQRGKEADVDACRLLHAYVGNSLRALQNEIEKLFIFVGERKQLTAEDIAAVVGATKGYTVFDLQNAIGRKDAREATKILERMIEFGESPQLIIVMLTRFFIQLYKLTELRQRGMPEPEIASELRISPFFLKSYLEFSSRFSVRHIEQNFISLVSADAQMKSSSSDILLTLELLLHSLIKGAPKPAESQALL